ncbi:MFS general substrate transporter [Zopfia rhizophila CBS 207.26]|uniref:MFS general substrate transporter n=1 Tax=Zopfia rhizophila CBS 207.26 TaxID=1314779 RepID=A0A6A6EEI5_9PEZI|nr:MFS general substrate transporter [Zopfia rhizophila CBS 207.26]
MTTRDAPSEVNSTASNSKQIEEDQIQQPPEDPEKQPDVQLGADGAGDAVDLNIVDWDGPNDPKNPMNWINAKKAKNILVICYLTFLTPLGSTMFAPAIEQVMSTYHSTSQVLASWVISVWVLGYFFGPLFLGPLSELYGRLPVYLVCNVLYTIFNIATAVSPSLSALIVFRFLAGTFGDMIKQENRGKVMAIWAMGPLMGPIIGPIAGGYMGQSVGWRWICWVLAISSGVGAIASFLFQSESYPPQLLDQKAKRLRKETGNEDLRSVLNVDRRASYIFTRAIIRPVRLLLLSPVVSILSIYQGVVYGYLYLLFTTFPLVFQYQYHFGTGTIGLTYLGMGVGAFIGLAIGGLVSDRLLKKLSGEAKTHWIVPIIGTTVIGIGLNILFMCITTYFIDAHPLYEASANAASTAVRSLIGALVPLAGRSMYQALGLGWGNSLLGFLALAMCPLPFFFYKYGERIRTHPKFQIRW